MDKRVQEEVQVVANIDPRDGSEAGSAVGGGAPWALAPEEVAHTLGISRSRVYQLLRAPDGLPSIKIGRSRRVLVTDLRRWLEGCRDS